VSSFPRQLVIATSAMHVADLPALHAIVLSHLPDGLPGVHTRGLMGKILPPVMGTMLEHRDGGFGYSTRPDKTFNSMATPAVADTTSS